MKMDSLDAKRAGLRTRPFHNKPLMKMHDGRGPRITLLLLWFALTFALPNEGRGASITIHVDHEIGRVSPLVFGANQLSYDLDYKRKGRIQTGYTNYGAGVWDPEKRRPEPEVLDLARQMGMPVCRFPGGCGTHTFDWKKTIGPVEKRPQWQFGVDEFMTLCRALDSEVIWTISYFVGSEQDAADLVEYLNGNPREEASPTGDVDWAARRTANGHSEPYGVRWFEFGNEVFHGNHNDIDRVEPEKYARRFVKYARAMKKIDPSIRLGAILRNQGTYNDAELQWTEAILPLIKSDVDFLVTHLYPPWGLSKHNPPPAEEIYASSLSVPAQVERLLEKIRTVTERIVGRALPIAITEFNGGFAGFHNPHYRHCLGTALLNAELLRIFMLPRSGVFMANYWQFANTYWGQIKGQHHYRGGSPHMRRPNYFPYYLYNNHFGTRLVKVDVECERYESPGLGQIPPCRSEESKEIVNPENLLKGKEWKIRPLDGVEANFKNDVLELDFRKNQDVNYFHAKIKVPAQPDSWYELSGWIKTEALTTKQGLCLAVGDSRGWTKTKSQALSGKVAGTSDWTRVSVRYRTLKETKSLDVMARRWGGRPPQTDPIRGKAWIRDVRLHRLNPFTLPATPYLSANASLSEDGRTLYVMVVNKDLKRAIKTDIRFTALPAAKEGHAWILRGPKIDSTNEVDPDTVGLLEKPFMISDDSFQFSFPSHSMTAIEIRRK